MHGYVKPVLWHTPQLRKSFKHVSGFHYGHAMFMASVCAPMELAWLLCARYIYTHV